MNLLVRLGLFPEQASTMAARVDALFLFITAVCVFFGVLVAALIVTFAIRYRRREGNLVAEQIEGSLLLETVWSVIPLVIAMTIFVWGAIVYVAIARPPNNALEIFVVGKQWMWKLQHMEGRREINELHIPTGRPVKLTMTSEDVIHSFFVPAFRVKADAVPGRYTTVWFEATKSGRYHLFCTEYCGTQHSRMIGSVIAMDPYDYQAWLAGDVISAGGAAEMISPAERGRQLFVSTGCTACHAVDKASEASAAAMQGPSLVGLYGEEVALSDGSTVVADEGYLRTSILNPLSDIVAGYQPVMPPYATRLSEEDVLSLIAYIRSLGAEPDSDEEPVTADAGSGALIESEPAAASKPSTPAPGTSIAGFPPRASDANPAAQVGATLDNSETKPGKAPTEKRP